MFTGIIETTGKIQKLTDGQLTIEAPDVISNLKKGSSIAVDGACLTVIELSDTAFTVDFMPETAKKTIILGYNVGDLVNLESAMKADGRFEGHMVTGHVEKMSEIADIQSDGNAHILTIKISNELKKYIVPKGSITINGISLTVVDVKNDRFTVSIIPHTWKMTNLHALQIGDKVNLETDIMAKHIEKLIHHE